MKSDIDQRERVVRLWFDLWLQKENSGIYDIFSPDILYIESWGPQYKGRDKINHWFEEWNTRGTVLQWQIKQYFHKEDQTVVSWYFKAVMNGGKPEAFDGMSLIRWTAENKICFLQEFGCNEHRYDPYQNSPIPNFRNESPMWF